MNIIKLIALLAVLLPTLASANPNPRPLTLTFHKNNQSLSSGSVLCYGIEHCNHLIKSLEYQDTDECRMIEIKDGERVVYRKRYDNY